MRSRLPVGILFCWSFIASACAPAPATVAPVNTPAPAASVSAPGPVASPSVPAPVSPYQAIVDAPDRSPEDRQLDPGRKPALLLEFIGAKPGMHIAELAAGGGYTTELLVRAVGEQGKVYGQNHPVILERFAAAPWSERLKKPLMQGVERIDGTMDDPLPGHEQDLDAVVMILFYHDTVWLNNDRPRMNRAVYAALKPGGVFVIADHSAAPGQGLTQVQTLHRIEESVVVTELEQAGFILQKSGDFLRNPADDRSWNASPRAAGELRGTSDRFILSFQKPHQASLPKPPSAARTSCAPARPTACTKEYSPVCAEVDTGVRCVTTPCPSTEKKTFGNACAACADPKVLGHVPGACPEK